jgi:hypothetical protein
MSVIDANTEQDRDWDWYASDANGQIAHFTSAGLRALPASVKRSTEAALELIAFFESLPERSVDVHLSARAEQEVAQLAEPAKIERRLRDFVRSARRGLFSYDTEMVQGKADYYLLASPKQPLNIDDLPHEVRSMLMPAASILSFASMTDIDEATTLQW